MKRKILIIIIILIILISISIISFKNNKAIKVNTNHFTNYSIENLDDIKEYATIITSYDDYKKFIKKYNIIKDKDTITADSFKNNNYIYVIMMSPGCGSGGLSFTKAQLKNNRIKLNFESKNSCGTSTCEISYDVFELSLPKNISNKKLDINIIDKTVNCD